MTPTELTLLILLFTSAILIVTLVAAYSSEMSKRKAAEAKQYECMDTLIKAQDEHVQKWDRLNKQMEEMKTKHQVITDTQQDIINQLIESLSKNSNK